MRDRIIGGKEKRVTRVPLSQISESDRSTWTTRFKIGFKARPLLLDYPLKPILIFDVANSVEGGGLSENILIPTHSTPAYCSATISVCYIPQYPVAKLTTPPGREGPILEYQIHGGHIGIGTIWRQERQAQPKQQRPLQLKTPQKYIS